MACQVRHDVTARRPWCEVDKHLSLRPPEDRSRRTGQRSARATPINRITLSDGEGHGRTLAEPPICSARPLRRCLITMYISGRSGAEALQRFQSGTARSATSLVPDQLDDHAVVRRADGFTDLRPPRIYRDYSNRNIRFGHVSGMIKRSEPNAGDVRCGNGGADIRATSHLDRQRVLGVGARTLRMSRVSSSARDAARSSLDCAA